MAMNNGDDDVQARMVEMSDERVESQQDDCNVICPYCLTETLPEEGDFDEHEREQECEKCGKTYLVHDEITVTHHTRALSERMVGE